MKSLGNLPNFAPIALTGRNHWDFSSRRKRAYTARPGPASGGSREPARRYSTDWVGLGRIAGHIGRDRGAGARFSRKVRAAVPAHRRAGDWAPPCRALGEAALSNFLPDSGDPPCRPRRSAVPGLSTGRIAGFCPIDRLSRARRRWGAETSPASGDKFPARGPRLRTVPGHCPGHVRAPPGTKAALVFENRLARCTGSVDKRSVESASPLRPHRRSA
jgi:hypothetical protein